MISNISFLNRLLRGPTNLGTLIRSQAFACEVGFPLYLISLLNMCHFMTSASVNFLEVTHDKIVSAFWMYYVQHEK